MKRPAAFDPADYRALPLQAAVTLPAVVYADPEFHLFERDAVFARSWQLVSGAEKLAQAGDHVVAEIAGRPIILVRGEDQVLRGFFNVCRHRAGPLALTDGNAKQLQCKYHGWTYTLAGQLRAAHEMKEAEGFDMSCIHLDAIQVAEWEGLVFAALKAPAASLEQLLAGIRERIRPIEPAKFRFHSHVSYDVACNWKAYVDNYLEGYHLPHVHPGLNKLLDYREYTTQTAEWYSYQHSPLDGSQGPYADGEAHYYFIYPNMMLNILPGRLQTNRVVPVSSGKMPGAVRLLLRRHGVGVSREDDRGGSRVQRRSSEGRHRHLPAGAAGPGVRLLHRWTHLTQARVGRAPLPGAGAGRVSSRCRYLALRVCHT